jgi:hypothetical protein
VNKGTDLEREFIERLREEMPDLLGEAVDFEALFGNILFATGDCVSVGPARKRIFAKPKKRRRKT